MKKTLRNYLNELDSSKEFDPHLAYNDHLNLAIWERQYPTDGTKGLGRWELKDEVRVALNRIADEFIEFLGVDVASVTDIILTGSNANYNWTDLSDVDLHIVLDKKNGQICPTCPSDDFISDCFQAKKTLWNSTHNITIHGFTVELYAQDAAETHVMDSGVYSLKQSKWLQQPEFKQITIDNSAVKSKSEDIMNQIDSLLDSQTDNLGDLNAIKDRIRKLRSSGLQKGGEFSIENLAFKALRNMGYLEKLSNYIKNIEDQDLSV